MVSLHPFPLIILTVILDLVWLIVTSFPGRNQQRPNLKTSRTCLYLYQPIKCLCYSGKGNLWNATSMNSQGQENKFLHSNQHRYVYFSYWGSKPQKWIGGATARHIIPEIMVKLGTQLYGCKHIVILLSQSHKGLLMVLLSLFDIYWKHSAMLRLGSH